MLPTDSLTFTLTGGIARLANEEAEEYAEEFRAEYYGDDIMSMYDDDPNPYAGTYSEE